MKKLVLTLMLLAFSTILFAQSYKNGSDKNLNLRSKPDANASVLTTIPSNAKVNVIDKSNSEWYKVSYDGKTGYVSSKYITEENNKQSNNNNNNSGNNGSGNNQSNDNNRNNNSGNNNNNNNSNSSKKSSSSNNGSGSSYNTGIGLRLGNWESGLTVKHFINNNAAIEGILSSGWYHRGSRLTALYEVQKPLGGNGFYWFWGVGGHVGLYNDRYWSNGDCVNGRYWHKGEWRPCDDGRRTTLGVDGIIGLEYKFPQAPFTLGIDFKPSIDLVGWGRHYGDGAFTVRYAF